MSDWEIQKVREALEKARRVFVLTGAGVSAESGVPTFRGGGTSTVWRGIPFEELSSTRMIQTNLPLVWEWFDYRLSVLAGCLPNAGHLALAHASESSSFDSFDLVTQNIDGLHCAAGSKDFTELHGNIHQARCLSCGNLQQLDDIPADERPPVCPECFDSMRPNVVLFGENLSPDNIFKARAAAGKSDLCFIVGTSANVYPANELPGLAKQNGALIVEINPENTLLTSICDISIRGSASEILPQIFAGICVPAMAGNEKETTVANTNIDAIAGTETSGEVAGSLTSDTHPIRVDFLRSAEYSVLENLGLTFAPGKKQTDAMTGRWNRDLKKDVERMRTEYGADTLVSLLEDHEFSELGINDLAGECAVQNIKILRFPIADFSVPKSIGRFCVLIGEIVSRLADEKRVIVHCKGGLGRAGTTAACVIVAATGMPAREAIELVRATRKKTVETAEQERFVDSFAAAWRRHQENRSKLLLEQETAEKEKVFEIACEGGGGEIYRFKAGDGKWYFCSSGSSIALDDDEDEQWISWENGPFETLSQGITKLADGYHIFLFVPLYILPEYRSEVEGFLENLYSNLGERDKLHLKTFTSANTTPAAWIARADEEMEFHNPDKEGHSAAAEDPDDSKHFLLYWQERSVLEHADGGYPLDVVAGNQLFGVGRGDVLWIVMLTEERELFVAGRLQVGEIIEFEEAIARFPNSGLWQAEYYAVPEPETEEYLFPISIDHIAGELRFDDPAADRLNLVDGKINPQQLRSLRKLTRDSAETISLLWEGREDDLSDGDELESMDPAERMEYLREIAIAEPDNPVAQYNLALAFAQEGAVRESITAYLKAIELEPQYSDAHYNLGSTYLELGRFTDAVDSFNAVILADYEFGPGHLMLGVAYAAQNEHRKAIKATRTGLEVSPDEPMAHFNIGKSFFALGEREPAISAFSKAAGYAPDFAEAQYWIGRCYRGSEHIDEEFESYLSAVRINEQYIDAILALGTAYARRKGRSGETFDYVDGTGVFELNDPDHQFYLGLGFLAMGEPELARDQVTVLADKATGLASRLVEFIDQDDSR